MIKFMFLFVALLLFTAAKAQIFEVTTADGLGADTYLTNDTQSDWTSPDSSHGDETEILLRHHELRLKIPYIRFDISEIKSPEATIEGAKIALWPIRYKGDAFPVIYIYALTGDYADDWDEMTVTFNTAPGFQPLQEAAQFELYDMVLVDSFIVNVDSVAPGTQWRDGIAYFQSEGGDGMDNFINNNDKDGLLTFTLIGLTADVIDHDYAIASKEDTITHVPKLIFNKTVSAIDDDKGSLITEYKLNQNYPNPFNPATNIEFTLAKSGHTTLKIYNTLGQPVATLIEGQMSRGLHIIPFAADGFSSGIYYYKLTSGNFTEMKKMILMK